MKTNINICINNIYNRLIYNIDLKEIPNSILSLTSLKSL